MFLSWSSQEKHWLGKVTLRSFYQAHKTASSSMEAVNSEHCNSHVAGSKSEHLGDSLEVIWKLAVCQF